MLRFLNGVSVYPGDANNKHLDTSTHKGFSKFCNWYKSTDHESTSSVALFEVQQRTESITYTNEVYSTDKSVVKGSGSKGLPKIMFLREKADTIVL